MVLNIPKQKDLKVIPKDTIVDAVVIDLEETTWKDLTKDATKAKNLKNPDGCVLIVRYDAQGFIRNDTFPFELGQTTSTSRFGRYCEKYGDFTIGQKIKVQFDEEGKSEIVLPKLK